MSDRLKVLKLYLENCGVRSIERLTGIRNRQISLWTEDAASNIRPELEKRALSHELKGVRKFYVP